MSREPTLAQAIELASRLHPRHVVMRLFLAGMWGLLCLAPCLDTRASSVDEIYAGVFYNRSRLPDGPESGGWGHVVLADLNVPGVELYATPQDSEAVSRGWEYRLEHVSNVVRRERLAAAVNATMFNSERGWLDIFGGFARSVETIVSDHVVGHRDPDSFVLWWDANQEAAYERNRPTSAAVLARAKWALGSRLSILRDGHVEPWDDPGTAARTIVGADPARRLVWLAVLDKATYRFANQFLADQGARFAVVLDGGSSSSLVIGDETKALRGEVVAGNQRPVATVFGIRARPLVGR